MASAIQSLPGQQPPPAAGEIEQPAAVSSSSTSRTSAWHSSGSIGPFFGVIFVLIVHAIFSCILGRVCSRRGVMVAQPQQPSLDTFKHKACYLRWWEKWKSRWCSDGGDIELGANNKVMAVGNQDCKANKNGEDHDQQPTAQA